MGKIEVAVLICMLCVVYGCGQPILKSQVIPPDPLEDLSPVQGMVFSFNESMEVGINPTFNVTEYKFSAWDLRINGQMQNEGEGSGCCTYIKGYAIINRPVDRVNFHCAGYAKGNMPLANVIARAKLGSVEDDRINLIFHHNWHYSPESVPCYLTMFDEQEYNFSYAFAINYQGLSMLN